MKDISNTDNLLIFQWDEQDDIKIIYVHDNNELDLESSNIEKVSTRILICGNMIFYATVEGKFSMSDN